MFIYMYIYTFLYINIHLYICIFIYIEVFKERSYSMTSPVNRSNSTKDCGNEEEVHSMQFKIILLGDGAVGKV
jgi:hypothetical protein